MTFRLLLAVSLLTSLTAPMCTPPVPPPPPAPSAAGAAPVDECTTLCADLHAHGCLEGGPRCLAVCRHVERTGLTPMSTLGAHCTTGAPEL